MEKKTTIWPCSIPIIPQNKFLCFLLCVDIIKTFSNKQEEKTSDYHIVEGKFLTPLELYLPGLVPKAAQDAHFQMLLPLKWPDENFKPVCVHFAGTGDHVRFILREQ